MLARAQPLLGTLVEIKLIAGDHDTELLASNAAFAEIAEIHHLMSFHEPESDISRLNCNGSRCPVQVDPRTFEVLLIAQQLSNASNGMFDCTVGAHLIALGFLPAPGCRNLPVKDASYRDVILLEDHRVQFSRSLRIDLGGIAKGYAVDRAIQVLREHGIHSACVNAGGDIRVIGDHPWPVSVRLPYDQSRVSRLSRFQDAAIATTAGYYSEKIVDGVTVSPLIDPRTGYSHIHNYSVSVIASSCVYADGLTKIIWLTGDEHHPLLRQFHARAFIMKEKQEKIYAVA